MKTYIVDSFTNTAFKGNPAGVCIVTTLISDEKMQAIAAELNLSETAFVQHISNNNYSIRYFSPIMEIPLCGHATLASAKIIFENTSVEEIHFTTFQNIELVTKKEGEKISMVFPVYETTKATVSKELLTALGISEINNCVYNKETNILLLEISSTSALAKLTPDFEALVKTNNSINGVLVTSSSTSEYDFHSRYFWPWSGSNEDPVTGATHTFLAKYWSEKLNKTAMKSFQASQRTGAMEVELIENNQLIIKGEAVIVFKGELCI
ncbi:PhzF family phenazine biosynthesis protein [Lutibacter holmesii]|uniref:PhzF family phenazine biosynthesis protein n=1 Tax=Lutibacter holmesii TaxID=1137985 RepID=A0ABW3WKW3_9FLAO